MAMIKAKTTCGTVVGAPVSPQQTVFWGIPFAKPPVGALRFRAPQPVDPWQGERPCLEAPPACIQNAKRLSYEAELSEDCLYLNVFTPAASSAERLPVMVWIFGGGFQSGSSAEPEFDGAALNEQGVILVTINYRCGPLGFFSSRALERQCGCAGNVGILDQIAALRWVQENIGAFGGNSQNVTIFGQSAGGISTRIHLTSPLSRGLFQKAIIQSGGGLNEADLMRPKEEFQQMCDAILAQLGWTVQDLMTRDALELSEALSEAAQTLLAGKEVGFFQPFLDGVVLKEAPGVAIHNQQYADVPIICGTVSGDSWMFSRKGLPELLKVGNESYYRGFAISSHQAWGRLQATWNRKAPFYAYYFERTQPVRPGQPTRASHFGGKTPHSSEIAYVFGTLDTRGGYAEADYAASRCMTRYWANFAKRGNPNGDGLQDWPAYTKDTPVALHFTDGGIQAENIVLDEDENKVLTFVQHTPGMMTSLDGFPL
ncbi:MAG: carboxylesterase family protein [Clostridiales bacterium]|nr:carboxylesterase family protein [Clostridiales bacterium]